MKILLLDIETAPNLVHTWGLFNQNISINSIIDSGYTICWSAKWLGDKEIFSSSMLDGNDHMLQLIHQLLDESDAVITYNGTRFDIPTLNKEFIKHGLTPPAPYKQIDLLRTARGQFRFTSNKLDYVAQFLGLGSKVKIKTQDLWKRCMAGEPKAMKEMTLYNRHDVVLLERVYEVMKPWIKNHANHSVHSAKLVCPNCGSEHYQRRGYAHTGAGSYARYNCNKCATWFRSNHSEAAKDKFLGVT